MKLPEIEISIKLKGTLKSDLKVVKSCDDLYQIFKLLYDVGTVDWIEHMILLCLNSGNKVIGYYKVSSGGTSSTVVDPKIIFTVALNCPGTTQIVISHNHPSGNTTPSKADKMVTEKLRQGAALLDIRLIDHIIYTSEGYYSFAANGELKKWNQ